MAAKNNGTYWYDYLDINKLLNAKSQGQVYEVIDATSTDDLQTLQRVSESFEVLNNSDSLEAAVIPINLGRKDEGLWKGSHWVGLTIKKIGLTYKAFYTDSLAIPMEESFPKAKEGRLCSLKQILINHGVKENDITESNDVAQQKNGYDCGPWTVFNLDSLARSGTIENTISEREILAQRKNLLSHYPELSTEENVLKIRYSNLRNLLASIKNKPGIRILEICSNVVRPDFLACNSFYEALINSKSVFFVDVVIEKDSENITKTVMGKLKNFDHQWIFQCRSPASTKVCIKDLNKKSIELDITQSNSTPMQPGTNPLTENEFIHKLSRKETFSLTLVVTALLSKLGGKFNDNSMHRSLREIGFDVNKTFDTWKIIDYAVLHDDFLSVQFLSMYDWNLSMENGDGKRTIEIAAEFASVNTISALLKLDLSLSNEKFLIEKNKLALLNLQDFEGNTPLQIAANKGKKDNVIFFLRCGSDINHRNILNKTAVDLAWEKKHYDVVLALLREDSTLPEGFTLEGINDEPLQLFFDERDQFHSFIGEGNLERVEEFVSAHKSKFYFNKEGKSALFTALEKEQYEIYMSLKFNRVIFRDEHEKDCIANLKKSQKDILVRHLPQNVKGHIKVLAGKSRCVRDIEDFQKKSESFYKKLDRIPEISWILKVIKYGGYFDIIFDFDHDSITDIDPESSNETKGSCDYKEGRIFIGAKVNEDELLGTLAHELTHLAMQLLYNNDCNPYRELETHKEAEFKAIVNGIKIISEQNSDTDDIIKRVFTVYKEPIWPSELVVRIPHMLGKYGEADGSERLQKQVPKLFEYYKQNVIPSCQDFIKNSFLIMQKKSIKSLNDCSAIISNIRDLTIQFKEKEGLNNFLHSKQCKVLVLNTSNTFLSGISVYQTLLKTSLYSSSDCYLFIKFKHFIKARKAIHDAFYSDACALLILEICTDTKEEQLSGKLDVFFDILNTKPDKKIIFIMHQCIGLKLIPMMKNMQNNSTIIIEDNVTLDSLTVESLKENFKQEIIFQRNKIASHEVFGIIDFDNFSKGGFERILDHEILVKLIENEEIKISNELIRVSDIDAAYSNVYEIIDPTTLVKVFLSNDSQIVHSDISDLFLIYTADPLDISEIIVKLIQQLGMDETDTNVNRLRSQIGMFNKETNNQQRILIDNDQENHFTNFKFLCSIHPEKLIYRLSWECGKFIFREVYNPQFYVSRQFVYPEKIIKKKNSRSRNNSGKTKVKSMIRQALKMDSRTRVIKKTYDENKLIDIIKNKRLILTDEPGMGKSTTLTKLLEKKATSNWIIRINLKDCQKALKKLPLMNVDCHTAATFLFDAGNFSSDSNSKIVKQILWYKLSRVKGRDCRPLLLLFDGFDEIQRHNEESKNKAINLIKFLHKKATVWVTARKHETETLQNNLELFVTEFVELNELQQEELLKRTWMYRFRLLLKEEKFIEIFGLESNNQDSKFHQFCKKLFCSMDKVFRGSKSRFIGIPLRMRLIVECVVDKFKSFIDSEDDIDFGDLDLLNIYEHFIRSSYDIYCKEKTEFHKIMSRFLEICLVDTMTNLHCKLAFIHLFEEKSKSFMFFELPSLDRNDEIEELRRVGIIQSNKKDNFEFIHKTFAEYFVAFFLAKSVEEKIRNPLNYEATIQFLLQEMFLDNNEIIIDFLNSMLCKDSAMHIAILNSNLEELKRLMSENSINLNVTDKLGRTPLHLAAQKGSNDIVKYLLEVHCDSMNSRDDLGRTPLHYAASYGFVDIIEYLVEKNGEYTNFYGFKKVSPTHPTKFDDVDFYAEQTHKQFGEFINSKDKSNNSSLFYAAEKKHWKVACKLFQSYLPTTNALTERHRQELLIYAAATKLWGVACVLILYGADINALTKKSLKAIKNYANKIRPELSDQDHRLQLILDSLLRMCS